MSVIEQIQNLIHGANDIVISGHINGDADSIGSSFAMAFAISKLGKTPKVIIEGYGEKYRVLPGFEFLYEGALVDLNPELFIALDCGEAFRLGDALPVFERSQKNILIDHHINEGFAQLNYVDETASSTCEMVYGVLANWVAIDTQIAMCLYSGILTDTGGFRFPSTTPVTLEVVSQLLKHDFDFTGIYEKLMYEQSLEQFTGWRSIINDFKVVPEVKLIYTTANLEKMNELNLSKYDLEGLIVMLNRVKEMDLAIFAYETEKGKSKVSFRSKYQDVNALARVFGGGGHMRASGAIMDQDPQTAVGLIIEELKKKDG